MSSLNPNNPSSFNHRFETLRTGRRYHFVDQKPKNYNHSTATILAIHGFPDLWYGWRNQIGPWVRKGYRVLAVDMLGYGGTDKPKNPEEYSTKKLCSDLAALLDVENVNKAVVIGHDWGSHIAGRFALWYPDRISSLVMLSVPFTPPSREYISVEEVGRRVKNLGYQAYFADPASTKDIEANIREFIRIIYQSPSGQKEKQLDFAHGDAMRQLLLEKNVVDRGPTKTLLSSYELRYYHTNFMRGGMNGPLSYYRTAKVRHEEEKVAGLPSQLPADLPVLFLWGLADPTSTPVQVTNSRKFVPRMQDIAAEGKGHWLMLEMPTLADTITDWLENLPVLHAKL